MNFFYAHEYFKKFLASDVMISERSRTLNNLGQKLVWDI